MKYPKIILFLICVSTFTSRIYSQTPGEILLNLKKFQACARVLYVAAHPDDENTRLISYLENSRYYQTAYLSLTRGDGGQNLIGNEQSEELGLIRTQELLAARREDGGEQFFTRAYDFGYSKNPEETFSIWNHDEILSDVVFVIRKFRPDIIIARFPTNGDGGHGHHTASAILAAEAFKAAADPAKFPEQLKLVSIWQAKRLFWNNFARWRNPDADMSGSLPLEINDYIPQRGLSVGEIAANSRSCHRSQGFGTAPQYGSIMEYFDLLDGTPVKSDILENIPADWKKYSVSGDFPSKIESAIQSFNPQKPSSSIPALLEIHDELSAMNEFPEKGEKLQLLNHIIASCAGLHLQLNSNKETLIPGEDAEFTLLAISRNNEAKLKELHINGENILDKTFDLKSNKLLENKFNFHVPDNAAFTNPYWLEKPHGKGSFTITDPSKTGQPDVDPAFNADVEIWFGKTRINVQIPVLYRKVDPSRGELSHPLTIQPAIQAKTNVDVLVLSGSDKRELIVEISGPGSAGGKIYPELPASVFTCEPQFYELNDEEPFRILKFKLSISPNRMFKPDSAYVVNLIYERDEKKELLQSLTQIKYDHIPDQTWIKPASIKLVHLNMKRMVQNIAYIEGAGDKVADCLTNAGYHVTMLNNEEIRAENLQNFDAVVMGIRAFNTRTDIPVIMPELLKYTENGGTFIVQYNTKNWLSDVSLDPGPYTLSISRNRVTDEDAKITFLAPDHPVLNVPNKITNADFEGWVQERGLYFPDKWDEKYTALISAADPKEAPSSGMILAAEYGKGHFIYTGISFFRELPAGVPGAYRLFANILAFGHAELR